MTVTKECAVCDGSNYLVSAGFSPLARAPALCGPTSKVWWRRGPTRAGGQWPIASCGPPTLTGRLVTRAARRCRCIGSRPRRLRWPRGASATCDGLLITPENVTLGGALTAFQIVASQVPAITITGEQQSVPYDGLARARWALPRWRSPAISWSSPTWAAAAGTGYPLRCRPTWPWTCSGSRWVRRPRCRSAPIQEQIIGAGGGIANGVLGTVAMTELCAVCDGSNYLVLANFAPIGAPRLTRCRPSSVGNWLPTRPTCRDPRWRIVTSGAIQAAYRRRRSWEAGLTGRRICPARPWLR